MAVIALVSRITTEFLARVFAPNFARSADRDREHENCCQTEEARATAAEESLELSRVITPEHRRFEVSSSA